MVVLDGREGGCAGEGLGRFPSKNGKENLVSPQEWVEEPGSPLGLGNLTCGDKAPEDMTVSSGTQCDMPVYSVACTEWVGLSFTKPSLLFGIYENAELSVLLVNVRKPVLHNIVTTVVCK